MNDISLRSLPEGIKAVLLDFDNTLYHYPLCHENAMRRCFEEYCSRVEPVTEEDFQRMYGDAKRAVKEQLGDAHAASHSRALYFQELFERRFNRTIADLTCEFERIYWNSFFEHISLRPWAKRFLEEARSAGIAVCIVTNLTTRIQLKKLLHCGLADLIDFVVTSEGAGAEKPDPKIFELALKKLGVRADEAIVIGDSAEHDVEGAERLGIRYLHLDESGT